MIFEDDGSRSRLDTVTLPGSETIEYSYFGSGDDEGKLASEMTPDAVLSFTYDGSLLISEQWSGGVSGTVTHGYDNRFQTASLRVDSLPPVGFDYDRDGLLIEAGDLELTRDPDTGFLTATALPASSPQVTDAMTYSAFGELESYTATYPGGSYSCIIDERDALGRITEKSETIGGVTTIYEYEYDVAGRLKEVTVDSIVTSTYHYDANGNRTAHDGAGGTPIATAEYDDQDRLREYGGATYEHTESGELLSKTVGSDTTTYSYDALGNLRRVEGPGGTPQIDYLVDGRNRRIGKKVNNVLVQKLLYQDQLEPIAEIDAAGNVSVFVYGPKPNVPDYMIRYDSGGTEIGRYRILSDHLGSVRLVLNVATGAIAQRIDYDEFGVVTNDTNPGFQPFGFAGGIWDSDDSGAPHPGSGLVLFGARDYDAAVGRWTAKDPIRFYGRDANLYGYVFNNPVSFTDPTGKFLGIYEEYEAWWGEEEIFGEQAARDPYGGGFRHCMWSCLNRARYGECVADNLNALHDGLYEDPTDVDSVRDITAEQRGHEIGADIPIWGSNAECQRRCAAVYPFPDPNDLTYQLRRRQK